VQRGASSYPAPCTGPVPDARATQGAPRRRRFAQALNATYGCAPSNADHCCLAVAPSSQLGQYGLLGLRPANDACSHLTGCSYEVRPGACCPPDWLLCGRAGRGRVRRVNL